MQTAENRTVSLRAIDGSSAALEITAHCPASDDARSITAAIGRLLDAARAGIAYRTASADVSAATTALSAPLPPGAPIGNVSITRLRAFYPIVRSQLGGLDLAVVSPGQTESLDAATIGAAAAYATRFGRRRIHVVGDETVDLEAWQSRYPELDFIAVPVATLIGRFAAGRAEAEVVVAPPDFAAILGEVAAVLSGAAALATVTRFSDTGITAEPAPLGDTPESRPSALILAAADLLVWLGRAEGAGRIVNGWARTLEHGCHTAEFSVLSPYSRQLDADDFATVIAAHLDDRPRALKLRQPGTDACKTRPAGGHLRLVG